MSASLMPCFLAALWISKLALPWLPKSYYETVPSARGHLEPGSRSQSRLRAGFHLELSAVCFLVGAQQQTTHSHGSHRSRATRTNSYSVPDSSPTIRSRSPSASHARFLADSLRGSRTPASASSWIALVTAGRVLLVAATPLGVVLIGSAG